MRALASGWLIGLMAGAVLAAAPAAADDTSYLADLTAPLVVHPPLSNADLLVEGRQVCFEVRHVSVSPPAAKAWVVKDMTYRHVPVDESQAGTLVTYALKDLCP